MSSSPSADIVAKLVSRIETNKLDRGNLSQHSPFRKVDWYHCDPCNTKRSRPPYRITNTLIESEFHKIRTTRSTSSKPSSIPIKLQKSTNLKLPCNIVMRTSRISRLVSTTPKSINTDTHKSTLEI